jgi:hypothetical protein
MPDVRVTVPNDYGYVIVTSTNNPTSVNGISALVQVVVKTLLTIPGRDVFAPGYGGGLPSVINSSTNPAKQSGLRADVGFSISKTSEDIINEQNSSDDILTKEERLKSLTLENLSFDSASKVWCVDIGVESEAGITQTVGLRNEG